MIFTLMGTGTSHGVPVIACSCRVCTSTDPKNSRLRASAFVENRQGDKTSHIVIDVGPEFRIQALRQKITSLDAVLLTHDHADHMHGLDDIRIFSHTKMDALYKCKSANGQTMGNGIPVLANPTTINTVKLHFDYIFKDTQIGGGKPKIDLRNVMEHSAENPYVLGGMEIIPIPMKHGILDSTGYLISVRDENGGKKSIVYLTDCNFISDESAGIINENAGTLVHGVIDGLRIKPHSTHFSFREAMTFAEKIAPRHTWLTHITHDSSHDEVEQYVKDNLKDFPVLEEIVKNGGTCGPAYDGLKLEI